MMSIKWNEPRPRIVRYITLRKLNKRQRALVGSVVAAGIVGNSKCEKSEPAETEHRDRKAGEGSSLLLREFEEANNWARLALQLYFGWFALQFTVNGIAMGWLFTRTGPLPWFSSLIFLVFVGWNLMGAIGTVMVYKSLATGDLRMKHVIEAMAKSDQTNQQVWPRPRSAMQQKPISVVFGFCVVTMFISLFFWVAMFVLGGVYQTK